jgi:hypothetical protein
MPKFRVTAARPTVFRAFQPPVMKASIPGSLWYEGGVLWGMGSSPNPFFGLPLAFSSAGAFTQCMQTNIAYYGPLTFATGNGPYGSCFQMAQWLGTMTCLATTITSQAIVQSYIAAAGYAANAGSAGLVFPASCFQSVTANSPTGNVTIPTLPLMLVCAAPASQVAPYSTGIEYSPYFCKRATN